MGIPAGAKASDVAGLMTVLQLYQGAKLLGGRILLLRLKRDLGRQCRNRKTVICIADLVVDLDPDLYACRITYFDQPIVRRQADIDFFVGVVG